MDEQLINVEFEKYIIFHRGIVEVGVKADGHLHVLYQDGTDQDLGDPLGDDTRTAIENVASSASEAQAQLDNINNTLDEKLSAAQQAAQNASAAQTHIDQVAQQITEKVDTVDVTVQSQLNSVAGIIYDAMVDDQGQATGKYTNYRVDLTAYDPSTIVSKKIHDELLKIHGLTDNFQVEDYDVEREYEYRLSGIAVGDAVDEAMTSFIENIPSLSQDAATGNYIINTGIEAASDADIEAMFTGGGAS